MIFSNDLPVAENGAKWTTSFTIKDLWLQKMIAFIFSIFVEVLYIIFTNLQHLGIWSRDHGTYIFILTFNLCRSMCAPVVDNASMWDIEATNIITQYQQRTNILTQDASLSMSFQICFFLLWLEKKKSYIGN